MTVSPDKSKGEQFWLRKRSNLSLFDERRPGRALLAAMMGMLELGFAQKAGNATWSKLLRLE
jgi:hypothetical protein